jgi:hypothetical protein
MRLVTFILGLLALSLLALFGFAGVVFAAEGDAVDPVAARAILEGLFTLQGATVGAVLIAALIQVVKARVPWIENGHEATVAFVASIALIVFGVVALAKPLDLVSDFGYLVAWIGLAKLVGAAYDTAKATKAAVTGKDG